MALEFMKGLFWFMKTVFLPSNYSFYWKVVTRKEITYCHRWVI